MFNFKKTNDLEAIAERFTTAQIGHRKLIKENRPEMLAQLFEAEDTGADPQPFRAKLQVIDAEIRLSDDRKKHLLKKMGEVATHNCDLKTKRLPKIEADLKEIRQKLCADLGKAVSQVNQLSRALSLQSLGCINLSFMDHLPDGHGDVKRSFQQNSEIDFTDYRRLLDDSNWIKHYLKQTGMQKFEIVKQVVNLAIGEARDPGNPESKEERRWRKTTISEEAAKARKEANEEGVRKNA